MLDTDTFIEFFEPDGLLSNFPGPVLLLDRKNEVVAANPQAYKIVHSLQEGKAVAISAIVAATLNGSDGSQSLRLSDDDTGISTDMVAIPVMDKSHVVLMGRDVSLDQNLRSALIDSRQRYKDLVEISSDFAWETNENGNFVFVTSGGALGYEPDEMVSHHFSNFVVGDDLEDRDLPFNTEKKIDDIEFQFLRNTGEVAELSASGAPIYDQEGTWKGARGICRDITEERERDAALARALHRERLITYIVRAMTDEVDPAKMLGVAANAINQAMSADACVILRFSENDGPSVAAASGGEPPSHIYEQLVKRVLDADGKAVFEDDPGFGLGRSISYHQEVTGGMILWRPSELGAWTDDEALLLQEVCDQLGIALEQVAAHERLHVMSTTDPLTGLFNRRSFVDFLTDRMMVRDDNRAPGVLAYVDLDNFKAVNDTFGHQAGDDVLIGLCNQLQADGEENDLIARLGGDEFAIWIEGVDEAGAPERAERILGLAPELQKIASHPEKPLGLSVGMAVMAPLGEENVDQFIGRADEVMYEVKHGGKGSYKISEWSSSKEENS